MTARLIDGKEIAAALRGEIAVTVRGLIADHGVRPGLAVVLVGEDPASQVYVRNKSIATEAAGMASFEHRLPADTPEEELLSLVGALNADPNVHGLLVQFPVPPHMSQQRVIEHINPDKDVDGLHPINAGKLASGIAGLVPCTPLGSLILAQRSLGDLSGNHVVIVGRSNLVGKPAAQLFLGENATVTIAHSRTNDLPNLCQQADILIAAVGRPRMIEGSWIKKGATVIDVGINRIEDPATGKTRLVGDVDFESAAAVAGQITPVPGGVGPMTIACLLRNTVVAACRQSGLPDPAL